jgi:hypothetical protein
MNCTLKYVTLKSNQLFVSMVKICWQITGKKEKAAIDDLVKD